MLKHANKTALSGILIGAVAAFSLVACHTAVNEATAEPVINAEGPALWTLRDADTTIHLFGFAPVLKTGSLWQSETIQSAFVEASLVLVESDGSTPEAQADVQVAIPVIGLNTDTTLSAQLSESEQAELDLIATGLGAPLQALDALKPWLASVQLGVLSLSDGTFDLTNTPLAQLTADAKSAGKEVRALEQPVDLMRIMAGFEEAEQVGMLMHAARVLRDRPDEQAQLADAWLAGDVETIGQMLHGANGAWSSDTVYQTMLVARNEAWAGEIAELMEVETGTVFFAVGFGHFAGQDSLIGMLEAKGHSVVRR